MLLSGLALDPGYSPGDGPNSTPPIDATTLRQKVLCGYQGWLHCPGDPAGEGWRHWSRDSDRIAPETVTFETWPIRSGGSSLGSLRNTSDGMRRGRLREIL